MKDDFTFDEKQNALDDAWGIMNEVTNADQLRVIKDTHRRRVRLSSESIDYLIEQAELAQELKIVKYKNGRPTVIDWNGERWVLDSQTTFKGGISNGKANKT